MKNILRISILLIVILVSPMILAQSLDTSSSAQFSQSKEWNKVGPRLQELWLSALKQNFPTQDKVLCFVRVRSSFERGDQSFLISSGFSVQVISGSIARGRMYIKDLPSVAGLPFVESIKLATK
ncbi:MAG: hypothetical protein ABH871_10305 [Pseudomonadota bacterium]